MEVIVITLGIVAASIICIEMYFYAKEKDEEGRVLFELSVEEFPVYLTEGEAQKRYELASLSFFMKKSVYCVLGGRDDTPPYMSFYSWLSVHNYRIA